MKPIMSVYDTEAHMLEVLNTIINKSREKLGFANGRGKTYEALLTVNSIQRAQAYYDLLKRVKNGDFDFSHQMLSINKTWDYKGGTGFLPTKNKSSVRKIQIDWQTVIQFSELVKGLPEDKPIFVDGLIYNSTANAVLSRHCKKLDIPVISMHGLRHTHASILLFAGDSIASVARRLGHASMTTTQKTYLHIIQELENQDIDLVMRSLSGLS